MQRSKIQPTHLSRNAYIYVRQSTHHQVQHHLESQQRQYELAQLAGDFGYSHERIVVIDDDLGISASGRADRAGFQRLVSDVALGRAGIVLGLEVSRLARNNRDWYELLDLCALKETLIGDADGIYDPATYNDRLLLGLKGTMSEAELHVLKGRMLAGLRHKATKGELRFRLSAGYEFDDMGQIVKTSDEEVAHFIELLFSKLFEIGSVAGVTSYLLHEGLRVPRREHHDGSIRWGHPYYRAVYMMVTNPIYAGTYAYGRTQIVRDVDAEGNRRVHRRFKAMAEWDVVLHGHHPAYIPWETFERIQRMMERNRPSTHDEASAALREGSALLQGIVRCGRCGRSMTVRYHGRSGTRPAPHYGCVAAHAQRRAGVCQSMGGRRIDEAVTRIFLEVMSESHLQVHMAALRKLDEQSDAVLHQLELQLERAHYEAHRCERQFNAVEPENRVVARTLEKRWNEALTRVSEIEQQAAERKRHVSMQLTEQEQQQFRTLARDFPKLWAHGKVTDKDRKALLRAAIEEVQLRKDGRSVNAKIVWKGGAVTETSVALIRLAPPSPTPADLVALVRELAKRHNDAQIARVLARRGIKTPRKQLSFTARHVADLRRAYEIPRCSELVLDSGSSHTVEQAAKLFGVSPPTIYSWIKHGVLLADQITQGAPWSVRVTDEDRARLAADPPPGWLPLNEAAVELAVSKQTILNWVKTAKIPYVYVTHGQRRGLRIDVESAPQRRQERLLD